MLASTESEIDLLEEYNLDFLIPIYKYALQYFNEMTTRRKEEIEKEIATTAKGLVTESEYDELIDRYVQNPKQWYIYKSILNESTSEHITNEIHENLHSYQKKGEKATDFRYEELIPKDINDGIREAKSIYSTLDQQSHFSQGDKNLRTILRSIIQLSISKNIFCHHCKRILTDSKPNQKYCINRKCKNKHNNANRKIFDKPDQIITD